MMLFLCAPAAAVTPIDGGDFEDGVFRDWAGSGHNGGFAALVGEGECFSGNDTTGLVLSGNYAALLRSDQTASHGSTGVLTSAPFTAGIGVAFSALTETLHASRYPDMPVDFRVRILSTDGVELAAVGLVTSVVGLSPDCYQYPVNGAFSTHYVDTRRFAGQQVRIQFVQSSRVRGAGLFTLVDDVIRLDEDDSQFLPDRPRAVAGVSTSGSGRLRLDGSLSTDPADLTLAFSWRVEGESFTRDGEFPCIDDLEPGKYQAALVVDNGLYIDADTIHFVVPEEDADSDELVETIIGGAEDCSDSDDGDADEEDESEEDTAATTDEETSDESEDE